MDFLIWIGIVFCISQSAVFSGLNLAFFSISNLQIEIEANKNNRHAIKIAEFKKDSNFLLTTILWGNVGINVLLTLLSNSVMAGVSAFLFSTFVITFLGEIMPQAYFSRHAIMMASRLSPLLRMYQVLLYPVAKPTSVILNKWLGPEGMQYMKEKDMRELIKIHVNAPESDIANIEGKGAMNFLALDDLLVVEEGEPIAPETIIKMDFINNVPIFPNITRSHDDPFLVRIHDPEKKWIILTNQDGDPKLTLDSDAFLRSVFFENETFSPAKFCHRPIIIHDMKISLGEAILKFHVNPEKHDDDVIDKDIILIWGDQKRIITGADILGRLLRGIVQNKNPGILKD